MEIQGRAICEGKTNKKMFKCYLFVQVVDVCNDKGNDSHQENENKEKQEKEQSGKADHRQDLFCVVFVFWCVM